MKRKFPFTAVILAGGRSSRMGRDKAFLPLGRSTFVERVIGLGRRLCRETIVVVDEMGKLSGMKLRGVGVYGDLIRGRGPLVALYTGLLHARYPASVVFTCDMPFVDARLIRALVEGWREDLDASCFELPDGRKMPFPGVYHSRGLALLKRSIRSGEFSMRGYLEAARVQWVSPPSFDKEAALANINTPDEYAEVLNCLI